MNADTILRFVRNEDGATAVEYAVMLAAIILVAIASIQLLGTTVSDSFDDSRGQIEAATGS